MRNLPSSTRIGWKVIKAKNVGENSLLRQSFFWGPVLSIPDVLSAYAAMRRRSRITTLGRWSGQMQGVNMERLIPFSVWLFFHLCCHIVPYSLYPLVALVIRSPYWFILVTRTQVCHQDKTNWVTKLCRYYPYPLRITSTPQVSCCRSTSLLKSMIMIPTFFSPQIARNRLGLNDKAHELAKAEGEKERQKAQKQKESADKEISKQRRWQILYDSRSIIM